MRKLLILILFPGAAQAHVGHLGEAAGHDHWVAGAAVAGAIALAAWQAIKAAKEAREKKDDRPEADPADPQGEEAEA